MATVLGKLKVQSTFCKRNFFSSKILNSTAAIAVQEQLPRFRTLENNPILHTDNHVAKFYRIDDSVKQKLFQHGGIPPLLNLQMKTFRENCLMVREPALEISSYLKEINFSHPAVRFVIYGKFGTGKSSTLAHLLHYGYLSKFLILHVPWVSSWTKQSKEVVDSEFKENMFDLPAESTLWLQHFASQNRELMEKLDLRTTQKYTWSEREVTEKGEPLMSVVDHGIQRGRHSSDCLAVLLKEIKILSESNKFKTMVVIDGVNAFFNKPNVYILRRPDKSVINPTEITICKAFMKILRNDWNNAVIITSVDIVPFNRRYTCRDPVTPWALLGKEGFESLDPFIPVETKNYSEKEFDSAYEYYIDRLWLQSERGRTETGRKQLKFLSGYNPDAFMKLCDPL